MHYTFAPEVQLAVKSLEIFRHWKEIVGPPGSFRQTGFVRIVPEDEIGRLKSNVEVQKRLGVKVEVISGDELKKIEPDWNVDDVSAVAYEPDSGYGDGAAVANDFLTAARETGVQYHPRTRATTFLLRDGSVCGVATNHGDIHSPLVVVATGQWTGPLFQQIGIHLPIETEFHQVAILRNPPGMMGGGCACIDSNTATYFRSEGHNKMLVGDFYGQRGLDPDNFPQRVSDESLAKVIERTCRRVPRLQDAEIMRGITGVYDMTPDSRPLLGQVPGVRGLHLVAGFSGMGFKISPAIGLVMSELLLEGRAHTVDISSFRPARFAEGKPIKAEFEYQDD
jgi:glycine/D-amino acid oxidase-like deaminating enzyme